MAEYKTSLSVFAVAAVVLGIFAYLTLRDDPLEAGMYPDNVTKEVYEKEYKNISKKDEYVSDWTIPNNPKVIKPGTIAASHTSDRKSIV